MFDWDKDIEWSLPGSNNVEILSADKFKRAAYAEFLTKYLSVEGENNSYVLNLNSEWGAGKTWFIKRWYNELSLIYPTVYIDAWQQDFSNDPLLTVISSVIEQLKKISGDDIPIPPAFKEKLFKLLKGAGKVVIKSAMNSAGIKLDDVDLNIEGSDVDGFVDTLCSTHTERYDAIQNIKKDIREWVEACRGKANLHLPAFILIDELDRCRPSYAVEMLETIKHIFDIPGIVFVVATDTEQLQHAIKAIYGNDFDARSYLGRFFRRRFSLHEISRKEFVLERLAVVRDNLSLNNVWPRQTCSGLPDIRQLVKIISITSDVFELSLRQTEQLIDRLVAIMTHNEEVEPRLNLIILTFLCAIHDKFHDVYIDVVNKRMALDTGSQVKSLTTWFGNFKELSLDVNITPEIILGQDIKDSFIQPNSNTITVSTRVKNPFKNTSHSIHYHRLIISLIRAMYIKPNMQQEHDRIYQLALNCRNGQVDENGAIALIRYEQGLEHTDISYYRSFVELATKLE